MFCLGCFGCWREIEFGWDCLFQVFSLSRVDFVVLFGILRLISACFGLGILILGFC